MKIRSRARTSAVLSAPAFAALLCLHADGARAQEATRIVAATVYPDSAGVERELRVPGGTRRITIACVPATVDVSTLQIDGDPEARLGDVRATALPSSRIEECAPSPTRARREALAQQRATLEAQRDANDLAVTFLRRWGAGPHADTPEPASAPAHGGVPAGVTRPGATAAELRRSALDLLVDQARVKRELEALTKEETRLADEQPEAKGKSGWRTVRFDVWTPAAATLRVRYDVAGTYWRPTYRASLASATNTLRIDRQAEIVQASGEDWSDVRVRLSTRRPRAQAAAEAPSTWWLDIVVALAEMAGMTNAAPAMAPMAPPAKVMAVEIPDERKRQEPSAPVEPPPWATSSIDTDGATEFTIAQPVTLVSDGESHTLQIASQSLAVTLARRATPRLNPGVYLLATAKRPAGVWPAGPLQAVQDGTLVGRTFWNPATDDKFEIALGRDDLMRVDLESPGTFTQARGVFGGSVERTSTAVYAIVNQHPSAVTVEVLDAAPVSRNDRITTTHTYDPAPATTDWHKRPGVAAWTLDVPAQGTRRVTVTHAVTAPKGVEVANLP
jgi:uncharacterized protein (TIGR02231 family)